MESPHRFRPGRHHKIISGQGTTLTYLFSFKNIRLPLRMKLHQLAAFLRDWQMLPAFELFFIRYLTTTCPKLLP